MSDKVSVLSVDDNSANLQLIAKALESKYDVTSAKSGMEALNITKDQVFDIILLDVNMPEINGYETCRELRASNNNADTPVLFISALTSLQDKLDGYAAGGNDYIEKPVMFEELMQKIELAVSYAKEKQSLGQQVAFATQTAMTAMSNNSELGVIVTFMESSFRSDDGQSLLDSLIEAISQYDIKCCAQLRIGEHHYTKGSHSLDASNLEAELLSQGKDADRIVNVGKRAMFNSTRASILIRNMPIEDPDKCGRLADHLAAIVVAADARCKHIEFQQHRLGVRDQVLEKVVNVSDEEIARLQKQFNDFCEQTSRIMNDLHTDIEESLFDFELSETQEDHFYRILEQGKKDMASLADWGLYVQDSLGKIKTTVTDAIERMD